MDSFWKSRNRAHLELVSNAGQEWLEMEQQ